MLHVDRSRRRSQREARLLAPRTQLAQLHHVPRALRLVWEVAKGWTVVLAAILVIQGFLPALTVYLTRWVVNSMVALVQQRGSPEILQPALMSIVLMGLVLVAGEVLTSAAGYVQIAMAERTQDQMNSLVQAKAVSLDLQYYESPEYYDQLQRASVDALDRPLALLQSLGVTLQSAISLLAMAGVMATLAWWMPLVLLVGTAPALWVAVQATVEFHRWRLLNTVNQRRLSYFHRILLSDHAAPEIRLFDLGGHFIRSYRELRQKLREERLSLARRQVFGQIAAGLLSLLSVAAALGWMALQAVRGLHTLGDLAMTYQAMNQGQRLMRGLLTSISDIYRNLIFLDDLFTFLDLEPQLQDPATPTPMAGGLRDGICAENVLFTYPDSERAALSGFNLCLPAGQVAAVVGENGAGKSTLLKLLCRFYDPDAGRITWDNVDLRDLARSDLWRRITVLFQRPVPYHDTAFDNIAFGDLAADPCREQIEAAARSAAADSIIRRLPEGYETLLGKWFGFTELSVGEWQRLALARAFLRQADLVILDEPTSAMDSWAEGAWMGRFRELVAGRTALIITHRFTTAMQADIIHVMHEGRVVESGTHAELVALSGRYAESWRMQVREAHVNAAFASASVG